MEVWFFDNEEFSQLYNCSFYKIDDVPLNNRRHTYLGASFIALFTIYEKSISYSFFENMEVWFFDNEEFSQLYNCSFYKIDDVPLNNRRHTYLGASFIALFTIYELLYIPCLFAIAKHLQSSCYKFMFYIGIIDVLCMWMNGFLTGYLALTGAVYCSHPTLIYWAGTFGLAMWAAETSSAVLLAVNRCIEIWSPKYGMMLFRGNRTWLWLIPPTLYALFFATFTEPVLFSGIYLSWFFNPHVGYYDDFGLTYSNIVHTIHNAFVLCGLSGLYLAFCIILVRKATLYQNYTAHRTSSQKMSFIQVLLISIVNASAAAIYVYMQFFRISDVIIIIGSYSWLFAHGMPSVIYMVMNRTIRNDCKHMLYDLFKNGSIRGVTGPAVTVTDSSQPKHLQASQPPQFDFHI
ncbi:serpentine type 7TM GPCR chemoreceptor srt domain-containing protein [Ditylenchus destructor]|uniref:Serpentine type 7TM GPCR chemoreceptor srt domain-containing protein n=1 Tax=Ditylenchus destructor TaxID=166010 RepID=A0AAD4MNP3_9BILA|nr:serpentine type 7TM GPCR chemoreceptor srt domain-containing protein [Ditylenchus destructor]